MEKEEKMDSSDNVVDMTVESILKLSLGENPSNIVIGAGAAGLSGLAQAAVSKNSSSVKKPTCIIVLGMAGSGKTSFVQRITAHLHTKKTNPYVINLDPACHEMPYPVNIDIRDTVKYKEVMKQYGLGPNGSIITSLNLFATKFDEVIKILDKRSSEHEYVIFDTPGQIEVFTWSASGTIITETLAATFPTIVVYVMDIVRSTSPVTFMSNMLYACSILYKTKLPFVIALNKVDIQDHNFALEWIRDFEAFEQAVRKEKSYASNLAQSMSLVLDEFYKNLRVVGVSAVTGMGIDEFFLAIGEASEEYKTEYQPEYERLKTEKDKAVALQQAKHMHKLKKDMSLRERVADMLYKNVKGNPETKSDVFLNIHHEDDEDDEIVSEEDEDEKREYEEFKKQFLSDKK